MRLKTARWTSVRNTLAIQRSCGNAACSNRIIAPPYYNSLVASARHSTALPAGEEAFEFVAARIALEKTRCNDGNEEGTGVEAITNPILPLLPPRDVLAVLEDVELLAGLQAHFAAEALAKFGEPSVLVVIVESHITHETNWILVHVNSPSNRVRDNVARPTN
jgi:hypothetical protein